MACLFFQGSDFFFGKDLEKAADAQTVTHVAGEAFIRHLEVELAELHDEHEADYNDHIQRWRKAGGDPDARFATFPALRDWIGRSEGVPCGSTFRERREKAWMMKGSAGPTESRKSYRNRQLQESVGDRCISIDHTHDAAKNWREPRASQASTPPAQPGSIPHFSKTPLTPATIGVECRLRPYRTSVHGSHQRHRDRRVSSRPRGLLNKA